MPPNIRDQNPNAPVRTPVLPKARLIFILCLLALIVICVALSWNTRDSMAYLPFLKNHSQTGTQSTIIDLRPWLTAEQLASMAVTAEEQTQAHEAEHLADHEVDQAFATGLREAQASADHRALKGEALTLSQKVTRIQAVVSDDQARVQALTQSASHNPVETTRTTTRDSTTNDDLELAKAQLGLDSDELNDAEQDLARALGDERGRIQQELAAHEAAMKKFDTEVATRGLGAVANAQNYATLASRIRAWFDQRTRYQLIEQAAGQAETDAKALMGKHSVMERQMPGKVDHSADKSTRLNAMRSLATHSQMLSIYDDRIQTQQQLGAVYRKWAAQVLLQHRIVFHLLMQSLALLAAILAGGLILDALIRYALDRLTTDRQVSSYRLMSRLAIQVVSASLMLLVVFGTPSEMPTILGLTTAGLTVVLQDFIISFVGWFILMGKNGIRVGDWVEINGVGGEVVEIGLFRTSVLETGNWTDHGHPTGRRVAFTNSFAIKGQYFNFTTSGQWMWDEITVSVPNTEEAYGVIELIHKAVLEETMKESTLAEVEWKRLGRDTGLTQFSSEAAVNMRPTGTGIDVVVRYVTRASTRYEVRNLIYQRVIDLLHKPAAVGPAT